jgi:hypothetical protein
MARDLDDFVIAAQLRVDDVVTFVREVEELVAAQLPQAPVVRASSVRPRIDAGFTRWDLRLAMRMWALRRLSGGRRRETLAAAVVVVALALATALGLRVTIAGTHEQPALAATPAADASAADVAVVQAAVPSEPAGRSPVPTGETPPGQAPVPPVGGAAPGERR